MVTAAGIAGVLVVFLFLAVLTFPKSHPEHMKMSPAEILACDKWARDAMHPTLAGDPMEITSANVQDVINDSIETGIVHPALALRKSQA